MFSKKYVPYEEEENYWKPYLFEINKCNAQLDLEEMEEDLYYNPLAPAKIVKKQKANTFITKYADGSIKVFISHNNYQIRTIERAGELPQDYKEKHIPKPRKDKSEFRTSEVQQLLIDRSIRRARKMVKDLALNNRADDLLFVTLTNGHQDTLTDEEFKKKIQRKCNDIVRFFGCKYLIIPERHPTSGRVHFHGLFWNYPKDRLRYSGKLSYKKWLKSADLDTKKYQDYIKKGANPIYNLEYFDNNGFTTATYVNDFDRTISYISKYITKDFGLIFKQYYFRSSNLVLPDYEYCYTEDLALHLHELGIEDITYNEYGLLCKINSSGLPFIGFNKLVDLSTVCIV